MAEKSTFDAVDLAEEQRLDLEGSRSFCVVYSGQRSWVVPLPPNGSVTIGRGRGTAVAIEDDHVSRRHALLASGAEGLTVQDLHSRNGTRVNGRRLKAGATRRLKSGDEIAIGAATLVVGVTAHGFAGERRVLAHAAVEDRLADELLRAERFHRPLAIVMLQIEAEASAPSAIEATVRAVASLARETDTVGMYGPRDLEVILPEIAAAQGELFAERAVAAAPPGSRAGVAVFPEDARSRDRMIAQARRALGNASEIGSRWARPPAAPIHPVRSLVAIDAATKRLLDLVDRVAERDITVLLLGETGTGKSVIAQEIHRRGPRSKGPLVTVSCGSIPPALMEAAFFGHEKGAFTGASEARAGHFEAAHEGTLFLDEIAEIPMPLQSRLLRVLEDGSILRVGATRPMPIDVRIVAATHRTLEDEVRAGRFREDLYFRVSPFPIAIPPLRDRPADIRPLAERFAEEFARTARIDPPRIGPEASLLLASYRWPGNVRELRNTVERAVVLCGGDAVIGVEHLSERIREGSGAPEGGSDLRDRVQVLERAEIERALEKCSGNQTRAARALGVSRRSLIYKMQKYGLTRGVKAD